MKEGTTVPGLAGGGAHRGGLAGNNVAVGVEPQTRGAGVGAHVLAVVALLTQKLKVLPVKRYPRVIEGARRDLPDVMYYLPRASASLADAVLAEIVASSAAPPRRAAIKRRRPLLHTLTSRKREVGIAPNSPTLS